MASETEQIQSEEGDKNNLRKELVLEIEYYNDLHSRIDSSLELAIQQAVVFYTLKPEIDRIKDENSMQ